MATIQSTIEEINNAREALAEALITKFGVQAVDVVDSNGNITTKGLNTSSVASTESDAYSTPANTLRRLKDWEEIVNNAIIKTSKDLIIRLNSGSTENTNYFTYNGSEGKTVNITPSSIGAAASGHTHNYLPLSGGQLTGSLNFSTADAVIEWNTNSYRQRIKITDDSTANTPVFTFQQSSDNGSSYKDLFTIYDNGNVTASTFIGNLTGTATGNLTSISYDSASRKLKQTKNGSTSDIVTFGTNAFNSTSYLPLSGGTMTGNITFSKPTEAGQLRGFVFNGVTDSAALYYIEPTLNDDGRMRFVMKDNANDPIEMAWCLWNGTKVLDAEVRHTFNYYGYTTSGTVTASSFKRPDGKSTQFLKADGSVDNTTYWSKDDTKISNWDTAYNWFVEITEDDEETDAAINKWQEIESFLAGISDTSTLNGILGNYYIKTDIDTKLNNKSDSSHTHNLALSKEGTATITLAHNTTYTLQAGGQSIVFKTPPDNNTTYNFSGTTFYSGNKDNSEHNANNAIKNGHYYYSSNGPATSIGASTADGALYVQSYSDSWVGQIAQDYRTGRLFFRGKNNGTWQSWLTNIDSGNYTNYAATKDHTHTFTSLNNKPTTLAGYGITDFKVTYLPDSGENLNNITTPGFYNAGGSNSVSNKPNNVAAFGLIVVHDAQGSYYTQILFDGNNSDQTYIRHCNNGTWGSWSLMHFTDTNTWRKISINNTSIESNPLNIKNGSNINITNDGSGNVTINSTVPVATSSTLGGIKVGYSNTGKNYKVQLDTSGNAYVNVPWANTNTTYSAGTGLTLSGTTFNHAATISEGSFGLSKNTSSTSFSLPQIKYNSTGHITSVTNYTQSIPTAGINSLGLVRGFHRTSGGVSGTKTTSASDSPTVNNRSSVTGRYYGVETDKDGYMFVNVPWIDTNTWRDIQVNNTSIDTSALNLINSSTITFSNTEGKVTANVTGKVSTAATADKVANTFTVFNISYNGSEKKTVSNTDFIQTLTEGTSNVTDGTMFITSYASNNGFADTNAVNVPYKRKASCLYNYIKGKTDSLYAAKDHTHSVKINNATKTIPKSGSGSVDLGNYLTWYGNANQSNMNGIARLGQSTGMTNLSTAGNKTDNPYNGGTESVGWHLYFNTCYTDGGNGSNSWVAQIANKAGTDQWWVRSRSGQTITNGTAWNSVWRHLVTSNINGIGNSTTPVYVDGYGQVIACSYTLNKTVPSDAKFTDTNTWRDIQINGTSINTNVLNLSPSTNIALSNSDGKVTISAIGVVTSLGTSGNNLTYTTSNGTTNVTVPYATSSDSTNSAKYLSSNNKMVYGWNGLNYFNASLTKGAGVNVNDSPSSAWWHILRFNHGNSSGYYTDLAIPFNDKGIYYKRICYGQLQNDGWVSVIDSLNLASSFASTLSDVTIANGDKLIISDASNSNLTKKTSIIFDGNTKTKALTQAGTWETFNNYTLPTASTTTIGGIKIYKDNSSYSVSANTSSVSANITSGPYFGVEIDNADKAFTYVPWTNYLTDHGVHSETASATNTENNANGATAGMLFSSGMYMTRTYNKTSEGMPTSYGNVLNLAGGGSSQLLLGWSGADSTTARMYYRSHRDTNSGGWGAWKTVAWTDDIKAGAGINVTTASNINTIVNSAPLYFVNGTNTATSGAWTGNLPNGVTEYYNGLTIRFRLSASPSGNATLQLGSLAACPVYINQNSKVTTHYPKGSILTLTYYDGSWYMANYDSSTWDAARMGQAHLYAGVSVYCNTLVGIGVDGKAYPITSQRQNSANLIASATYDTNPRQFGILYNYTGGNKTAGNALQTYCLYEQRQIDWRFVDNCVAATYNASTNTMGLQAGKPVYIKVAIADGGWYPIAQTTTGVYNGTSTYTRCWTQTEFTKGSYYIYVGIAYNSYCIFFTSKHNMYYAYNTNKLQSNEYNSETHTHTWASITNKIVEANEFNIVSSGYNSTMWFNYLPYDNRNKTAKVIQYVMGNGNRGHASVKASTYYRSDGTEVTYSGHQHYVGTSRTQASSANQLLTGVMLCGIDNTVSHALLQSGANRTDDANGDTWIFWDSKGGSSTPWGFKHNQKDNYIEFYGSGTRRCFIDLNSVTNSFNGSADMLDGYHASNIYNASKIDISNANSTNSYIQIAKIVISGTALSMAGFTAILSNRECLDYSSFILTLELRRNSTTSVACSFYYTDLQSYDPRDLYVRSNDGQNFYVYFKSVANTYTTYYTLTPLKTEGSVTFSNTGLAESSLIEGTVLNKKAVKGGNVASATSTTKLTTSRTIWGQEFDGTKNISGSMTGVTTINTANNPASTIYMNNWFRSIGATGWYSETYGGGWYMQDTSWIRNWGSKAVYLNANLCVGNNAKIGIGTTSPAYLLDVAGKARITGPLLINGGEQSYCEGIRIAPNSNGWTTIMLKGSDNTADSGTSANSWGIHTYGGNFYINKNGSNSQQAPRLWGHSNGWSVGNTSINSYTLNVGGTTYTTKLLATATQDAITVGGDGTNNTYISALSGQLIINNGTAGTIRFGASNWDWNAWAGLKYVTSTKTIHLGLPDGTIFNYNSAAQTNGTLNLVNIKTLNIQNPFVITGGGIEITGVSSGASYATSEGLYTTEHNNLILRGDATYGKSGILFTSSKGTTSINQPSDKGFIQFQSYGGTATSGESNRLVIGVGNDADDKVYLQTPSLAGLIHAVGTLNYVIPANGNDGNGLIYRNNNLIFSRAPSYSAASANNTLVYSNYYVLKIRSKSIWDATNNKSADAGYEYALSVYNPTDKSVYQSKTNTTYWRPILTGYSNVSDDNTEFSAQTNQVYWSNSLRYQPSTGTLKTTKIWSTDGDFDGNLNVSGKLDVDNALTMNGGCFLTNGVADLTGGEYVKIKTLQLPTTSNGTTYGPGTNGQVLKSNGTSIYWANDNNSDTKNTAGSTNSSSKLFLIGATTQANNPQTYSNQYCYASNGVLYSGGAKVLTSETSLKIGSTTGSGNAITNISVSGHTINLTKGSTFLTSHQSLAGYLKGSLFSPGTAGTGSNKFQAGVTQVGVDGVMEVGKYIDFHYTGGLKDDYNIRLICPDTSGNYSIEFPQKGGTIALLSDLKSSHIRYGKGTNFNFNNITDPWLTHEVYDGNNAPTESRWNSVVDWGSGDSNYRIQLGTSYTEDSTLYIRHKTNGSWKDWKALAVEDDYVKVTAKFSITRNENTDNSEPTTSEYQYIKKLPDISTQFIQVFNDHGCSEDLSWYALLPYPGTSNCRTITLYINPETQYSIYDPLTKDYSYYHAKLHIGVVTNLGNWDTSGVSTWIMLPGEKRVTSNNKQIYDYDFISTATQVQQTYMAGYYAINCTNTNYYSYSPETQPIYPKKIVFMNKGDYWQLAYVETWKMMTFMDFK